MHTESLIAFGIQQVSIRLRSAVCQLQLLMLLVGRRLSELQASRASQKQNYKKKVAAL
jgi:hypothetical protein